MAQLRWAIRDIVVGFTSPPKTLCGAATHLAFIFHAALQRELLKCFSSLNNPLLLCLFTQIAYVFGNKVHDFTLTASACSGLLAAHLCHQTWLFMYLPLEKHCALILVAMYKAMIEIWLHFLGRQIYCIIDTFVRWPIAANWHSFFADSCVTSKCVF